MTSSEMSGELRFKELWDATDYHFPDPYLHGVMVGYKAAMKNAIGYFAKEARLSHLDEIREKLDAREDLTELQRFELWLFLTEVHMGAAVEDLQSEAFEGVLAIAQDTPVCDSPA